MSELLDASILIVGYKSIDLIGPCLKGVFEHTQGLSIEVLYVDNSGDGSAEYLAEHYPQVRVLEPKGNLGFAGGNNYLAQHAKGRWILLLNPDTLMKHDAIGELVRFGDTVPQAGAVGGLTLHEDGSLESSCIQPGPSLYSAFFNAIGLGRFCRSCSEAPSAPVAARILSGAFMAVRRELWCEIDGFDESYYMYNDEVDLCLRIAEQGRGLWLTPEARVIHLVGSGDSLRPARLMMMTKSGMHLTRRRLPKWRWPVSACLILLHASTRYFGSWLARPLVGAERSARLREAFGPVLFHPAQWWFGYDRESDARNALGQAKPTPLAIQTQNDCAMDRTRQEVKP